MYRTKPAINHTEERKTRENNTKSRAATIDLMSGGVKELMAYLSENLKKPGFLGSEDHIEVSKALSKMCDVMYA